MELVYSLTPAYIFLFINYNIEEEEENNLNIWCMVFF